MREIRIALGHDVSAPTPPDAGPEVDEMAESLRRDGFGDDEIAVITARIEAKDAARTPCSIPECDTDGSGEPCATHEEEQAHAAGQHEFCGATCEVEFPSELLRNTILSRAVPGSKNMLAELERRAAATTPPAPNDELRQAIAAAIGPNMLIGLQDADLWGPGGTERIGEWVDWIADAVLPLFNLHHPPTEVGTRPGDANEVPDFVGPSGVDDLRQALTTALRDAAHVCGDDCPAEDEAACHAAHPVQEAVSHHGVVTDVYGPISAIADLLLPLVAARDAQTRAQALRDAIPAWEAVYEPGNVSDYLIGYTNAEAPAKAAAIAWFRSECDTPNALEWAQQGELATGGYDEWFDLAQIDADDGMVLATGITVRRRTGAIHQEGAGS